MKQPRGNERLAVAVLTIAFLLPSCRVAMADEKAVPAPTAVTGTPGGGVFPGRAPTAGAARVTVMGAVRQPGVLPLLQDLRLAEALVQAGGPLPSADLARVLVNRDDLTTATVNFFSETGRALSLRAGDVIVVPELQATRVTAAALGEVVTPGPVDTLRPGATLLDLLKAVGGPTASADLRHALLRRPGEEEPVPIDLEVLWRGGEIALNRRLLEGDTVVIPRVRKDRVVYVLGGVAAPAAYPVRGGETLAELLARSGAPVAEADLTRVTLTRRDPQHGTRTVIRLNLNGLNGGNAAALATPTQPGDIIMVPVRQARRANRGSGLATGSALLGVLGALGRIR